MDYFGKNGFSKKQDFWTNLFAKTEMMINFALLIENVVI